jgi:transcriptional regulator with XRE-family HTH domain
LERGGIVNPKIETVIKLADALNVSLDELVGRKPAGSA